MSCTANVTKCLAVANQFLDSNITLCNNTAINRIVYNYKTCDKDSVVQINNEDHLECVCITSPMNGCEVNVLSIECKSSMYIISSVQAAIAFLGIAFNLLVCLTYYRRKVTRKKIPNILLVNQALADLFNCIMYALPTTVRAILYLYKNDISFNVMKAIPQYLLPMINVIGFVSIASSVNVYTIVAFERLLAIVKPLWHHANVRKRHIWGAIVIAWFLSFNLSIPVLLVSSYIIYIKCMQAILIVVMAVITTLFCITWYKALKQIQMNQKLGRNTSNAKKELHLTKLFAAMYVLFLLTYFPIALADLKNPTIKIKVLLFNLTAMINPIFTLTLKQDFRCRFNSSPMARLASFSSVESFEIKSRTYSVSNISMSSDSENLKRNQISLKGVRQI